MVLAFPPAQLSGGFGKGLSFAASFQEGCNREELQDPNLHVLHFSTQGQEHILGFLSLPLLFLTPNGLSP